MLAWQTPASGHLSPTPLLATNTRTILVSGQLQLRTILSRPEGVRLQELRLYQAEFFKNVSKMAYWGDNPASCSSAGHN